MEIILQPETRVFILEGIPGAGKNTLHEILKEKLTGKVIYDFGEEELLFSWKHAWIQDIDSLRLQFYENILDYCEEIIAKNPEAVFIFNRFHISYRLSTKLIDQHSNERYKRLLERLKKINTFVIVPIVAEDLIEVRAAHKERIDPVWQGHLKKRLAQRNCTTLTEMYSKEQKDILQLLEEQGLLFQTLQLES